MKSEYAVLGSSFVTRCCVNDRMIYYSETTLYILVRADVMNVLVHLVTCAYYYMCNTLPLLKETKQNKTNRKRIK